MLFEALEKTYQPLKPDSVLNFSIDYYKRKRNSEKLAKGYFYKGRSYKYVFRFAEATTSYILALDNLKYSKEFDLLAKIYSDLGEICSIQNEFKEARDKYSISIKYCNASGREKEAQYRRLDIGKTYRSESDYKTAHDIFDSVFDSAIDSVLSGIALQEIGINYFFRDNYDSAVYYLKRSLSFPYIRYNQSIRYYKLSDSYFELANYDSAFYYAQKALHYPATFFTKKECYRVLANSAYVTGDYKTMAGYMTYYQAMSDSVRNIDIQTKSTVIENIYQTNEKANKSKRSMWISLSLLPLLFFIVVLIYIRLRNRSKGTEVELEHKTVKLVEYEQKLHVNNEQLKNNLLFKIEEVRKREKLKNKRLTLYEKQELDRKIFEECLYIDDAHAFDKLMNLTFNNILLKLHNINPELSRNEMMYCCLLLLDLNTQEIMLILNIQLNTIYKLKQRLAQKLKLNSSTDVVPFLKNLWAS
jgi:tetratricopeptide (TPR) repeat protein